MITKVTVPLVLEIDMGDMQVSEPQFLAKLYVDRLNACLKHELINNVRLRMAEATHSIGVLAPGEIVTSLQNWECQFVQKHQLELDEVMTYRLFCLLKTARTYIEETLK